MSEPVYILLVESIFAAQRILCRISRLIIVEITEDLFLWHFTLAAAVFFVNGVNHISGR
jgi:hypothetical protein